MVRLVTFPRISKQSDPSSLPAFDDCGRNQEASEASSH
jgi:hypothetical protein